MSTSTANEAMWNFADKLSAFGLVYANQATKFASNLDSIGSNLELIGSLGDGDWIIWTNPSVEGVSTILENLKQLLLVSNISLEESAPN